MRLPSPTTSLLLLWFLACSAAHGQDIYGASDQGIYQLDSNHVWQYHAPMPQGISTTDLALAPNGKFYALRFGNDIVEIDVVNHTDTIIGGFPFPTPGSTSLVCSNNDELYALSYQNELWKFNLNTGSSTLVANLGTSSPGDLTFYQGNLIFQDNNTRHIVAYNFTTGTLATVICQPPLLGQNPLWGLSTIHEDCKTERVIASDWDNNFYELDFDSNTIHPLTVNANVFTVGETIMGLASVSEHLGSACPSFAFNNLNCNPLNTSKLPDNSVVFYPNPNRGDLHIQTTLPLESVTVYDVTGKVIQIHVEVEDYIG